MDGCRGQKDIILVSRRVYTIKLSRACIRYEERDAYCHGGERKETVGYHYIIIGMGKLGANHFLTAVSSLLSIDIDGINRKTGTPH